METKQAPSPNIGIPATTTYSVCDTVGHVLGSQDASGNATDYIYNALGELYAVSDANGGYLYTYDVTGRPASLEFPDTTTQAWTYDPVGNHLTTKNRAGGVQTSAYDDRTRPENAFGTTV